MSSARTSITLGQVVITPGAIAALNRTGEDHMVFITRFSAADFGSIDANEKQLNDSAIQHGGDIFGSYLLKDRTELWILNEPADVADGSRITTILLPEEEELIS